MLLILYVKDQDINSSIGQKENALFYVQHQSRR